VDEPESKALDRQLDRWGEWISCSIAQTEVLRACRLFASQSGLKATDRLLAKAEEVLRRIALLDADYALLGAAAHVDPIELRALDAIHLAAALSLGDELGAMFTYDRRLSDAARQSGLEVLAPA
jgi:predicted nucleic acid-binding protein